MAKRYGLDSIIGKKSTIRFPRSVQHTKTDTICTILSANNVISEPPFSTAITMKKGDSLDICDQLNELSYEYESFLPIKADILLSNNGSKIDFKTPTVFSLINIIFDLDDLIIENMRSFIPNLCLTIVNISLAKIDTQDSIFLEELIRNSKIIYGNLSSYNCRRRKDKRVNSLKNPNKLRKFAYLFSKKDNHRRDLHFFLKNKKVQKVEKLPILFETIDTFYDLYDDWDDFYDEYYQDYYLNFLDQTLAYSKYFEDFYSIFPHFNGKHFYYFNSFNNLNKDHLHAINSNRIEYGLDDSLDITD